MSFAHLTLATRDVIASRDFFAVTLGWEPIERPGNIDVEAAWLRIAPRHSSDSFFVIPMVMCLKWLTPGTSPKFNSACDASLRVHMQ